jgi:hypothetical protein
MVLHARGERFSRRLWWILAAFVLMFAVLRIVASLFKPFGTWDNLHGIRISETPPGVDSFA